MSETPFAQGSRQQRSLLTNSPYDKISELDLEEAGASHGGDESLNLASLLEANLDMLPSDMEGRLELSETRNSPLEQIGPTRGGR
jgi:hypothetical protein